MFPKDLMYTDEHEWIEVAGGEGIVGITSYAAEQLGDIVFVELPEVGDKFKKGDTFGTVESVKAVSDLYMPVDGEVIAINEDLEDAPELVNSSPYDEGWMIKITVSTQDQVEDLMDAAAYETFVEEQKE